MRRVLLALLAAAAIIAVALITQEISQKEQLIQQTSGQSAPAAAFSTLPVIRLEVGEQLIQKEAVVWGSAAVYKDGNTASAADFETPVTIKYRGNSSYLVFDKKSFRVKFFTEEGKKKENNYALLGMATHYDWVLYGPFLDRTLLRNYVIYKKSRQMFSWAPDTRFCEVYLNGEYLGVYLAVEPVTVGSDRINLEKFGLLSGRCAYLLHRDREGTEDPEKVIETYGNRMGKTQQEVSIDYPSASLTAQQKAWIQADMEAFEEALYSEDFADPEKGYAAYINVDSFVNYYILNEFTINVDASLLSTYFYKTLEGKLDLAIWDYNNAFDNYPWEDKGMEEFHITTNNWFDRLLQDRAFTEAVVVRYRELRQGIYSDESWCADIDEGVAMLGDAVERNYEVWGYTFKEDLMSGNSNGDSRDPESYRQAVKMLKDCIRERGAFMDAHIEDLYDICIN